LKKQKFQQDAAALEAYSNADVASSVTSGNLAYLIYTSGTTGNPKGVMIEHRGVINLKEFFKTAIGIGERDRLLQFANIAFDASVWEIAVALLNGAVLHMVPREIIDSYTDFEEYLERNIITTAALPPPYLDHLNPEKVSTLKTLITAGSESNHRLVNRWRNKVCLINGYGPTETTVSAAIWKVPGRKEAEIKYPTIPIGKPIANYNIYILDQGGALQLVGVAGELYIAGPGLARGYLNQPLLTAEKFPPSSLLSFSASQLLSFSLYRTGDLARWLADGNIEFLGRIDHQVKIRGFRIELSEIESRLLHHEGVKETVVLAREDNRGEKYLCAYIVPNEVGAAELREYLSGHLPGYMIPNYFLMVDKIPLTLRGKVDRKSLPLPSVGDVPGGAYDAPADEVEKKLAEIWADILQLEREKMGRDTGFFDVGGHSLNAITMISRVHKELNVKIPLAQVFKHQTIAGLSWCIKTAAQVPYAAVRPAPAKEYYPLSSAQKRMYLVQQFISMETAYNISTMVVLKGKPDKRKMEQVLRKLIMRHESLRTSFHMVKDEPMQKVHDKVEFKIEYLHAPCSMPHAGTTANLVRLFDLGQAPLLRVGLIKTAEEQYLLVVDLHHIISDGVSQRILIEEFIALYKGEFLSPLRLQYKDYAWWQHELKVRGDESLKNQEEYWLSQLGEEIPVMNLHTDYPRPRQQSFAGESPAFIFNRETTAALRKLAAAEDATLYMILLGLYNILLSVLSGQEDIIVGTPVAGRRHADLEPIVGIFINTLALRNYPSASKTFTLFLRETRYRTVEAFENQDYPFEELVEQLASCGRISRDISRNPLCDIMFRFQDAAIPTAELPGLNVVPLQYESKVSRFDMSLVAVEADDHVHLALEYCTSLFKRETIARFINHFQRIVSSVLEDPGKRLMEIEIISPEEKQQVLYRFNDTQSDYPREKTIHQLYAEQVEQAPDRIAIIGMEHGAWSMVDTITVTYKELNKQSNQLAYYLRKRGVGADTIVGIMEERSIEMMVGLLGILKAGGAYLPIEAGTPERRIVSMLEDSGTPLLLTKTNSAGTYSFSALQGVTLEEGKAGEPVNNPEPVHPVYASFSDLAYVIFTSGSTGSPKGTLTTHANVVRVVRDTNYIDLTPDDRILQLSTYAFDGSVFDIYGALLNGAVLVLVCKEDLLALDRLSGLIRKENITTFFITTALFNTLVDLNIETFDHLRSVLVGGERISVEHTRKALDRMGKGKILNMYGPTETTVFATYYPVNEIPGRQGTIPIGRPVSNTSIYIFDKYLHPQPIGVVGELWIGGDGNARGYLNNPELTNSKFQVPNYKAPAGHPLSFSASQLLSFSLYRTGDLARWLPDPAARGAYIIEFIGRIDQQVKIRGFRIEPGEIEAQLLKHELVKEAVVTIQSRNSRGGDNFLCAYVVVRSVEQRTVGTEELKQYLLKYLPDYMVPAFFMILAGLPTTRSGKIDRNALPGPGIGAVGMFVLPRDPTEKKLAGIWAELLGIEKNEISINDDFFELGGHSLSAAGLASRVHKEMNVKIPMAEIFKGPSIKELSNYIKQAEQDVFAAIEPVEEKEYYALSLMQERLFVLEQLEDIHTAYNLPHVMMVEGELDHLVLEKAFCDLIARHESLRTSLVLVEGRPYQRIHKDVEFNIEYDDSIKNFVRPFDLSRAPLFRVGLIKEAEKKHILMVDMHHIISDGSSITVLVKDFAALYQGRSLPRLMIRYRDFSGWQHSPAGRAALEKQETWWLETFKKDIPVLDLFTDYPRPPVQSFKGESLHFTFEKEVKERIYQLMKETNTTLYMVLLAALNVLLFRYSGAEDIVIGTAAAGREHVDFQQVIGLFINALAMRNYPQGHKTFGEFLEEVKQNAAAAFQDQGYPYGLLLEKLKVKKDVGRNPLFDVELVVQNMEEPRWETKDLSFSPYDYEPGVTQVDMGFYVMEAGDQIHVNLVYCTDLFKKETIERLIGYFKEIITCLLDDPGIRLADIIIAHHLEPAAHDRFEDDEQDFGF
jgi:amino acid adenylation domain-containing protein